MSLNEKERLDDLRQRLYERGQSDTKAQTHQLTDEETDVATEWKEPPKPRKEQPKPASDVVKKVSQQESYSSLKSNTPTEEGGTNRAELSDSKVTVTSDKMGVVKKKKKYRLKLMLLGLVSLVLCVIVSSVMLLSGSNNISGENIAIAITGPFTVGGGEVMPLQVGITNGNMVPIESATLIVEYPQGSRSASDNEKDLFTERLQLDTIASGETLNIPLRAKVYGEENQEKEIKASIEYRIEGSNALFFKEAEPLRFKIGSSPVSIKVENNIKVSSGQETDIVLTVSSNSSTELSDILVKADYPSSFDFSESDPEPRYGENMWLIENLEPESSETILIKGLMIGRESDKSVVDISVGVPTEKDPQELASIFVTEQIDFEIEQPFVDIELTIDSQTGDNIAITPGKRSGVEIKVSNNLEDTLYDTVVVAELSGNALSDVDVSVSDGFYDSVENTITWDVGTRENLEQIVPGSSETLAFSILPDSDVDRTPQIAVSVNLESRRVSETRVSEKLIGTASAVLKLISTPELSADVGHNNSTFTDTGLIPPVVEEETTYTLSYMIENGSNEVTDVEVSASLPPYVTWTGESNGVGGIEFNEANRVLTWNAGDMEARSTAFVSFQVEFLPSQSQIGTTPTLIGSQRLKATDRFTGSIVKDTHQALTTRLSEESGFAVGNGEVQAEESLETEEDN